MSLSQYQSKALRAALQGNVIPAEVTAEAPGLNVTQLFRLMNPATAAGLAGGTRVKNDLTCGGKVVVEAHATERTEEGDAIAKAIGKHLPDAFHVDAPKPKARKPKATGRRARSRKAS